jgi:hypothetical protein
LKKRELHEVHLEVVILLSDSEDGTAAGGPRKNADVCQCVGEKRTSGITSDSDNQSVEEVPVSTFAWTFLPIGTTTSWLPLFIAESAVIMRADILN